MIFNKDSNGAVELKELLGFIYKSIHFENLISYLGFAEKDLKNIVGKEILKLAEDHYKSANYHHAAVTDHPEYLILDDLVKKVQFPLAILAYRRFVPSNDLTHSDKGRQINVTETEKTAFEWQIEKDNQNLLSLAYEAIDFLLEFLDEHNVDDDPVGEEWNQSDAFKKSHSILISLDQFNAVFPISGSRRLFITLTPFIIRVQKNIIVPVITKDIFDSLIESIKDKDTDEDDDLLLELIHPVIAYATMSMALKSLPVEVLPEGIFQAYIGNVISGKNSASRIDRIEVAARLDGFAKTEMKKLQDYLTKKNPPVRDEHDDVNDSFHKINCQKDDKFVRF